MIFLSFPMAFPNFSALAMTNGTRNGVPSFASIQLG
jgi:hypothetical protein